ncbi:MAG: GNAT family N-acetyltransferase [Panacagrimonas sp.]
MDAPRLEGGAVQLWPLTEGDAEALHAAADAPGDLFRYLPDRLETLAQHREFIARALAEQAQGKAMPFTVRLADSGEVVGTTRFGAMELAHARAEIGWTWIARKVQRSVVNTQAKRLLLAHGFEAWNLGSVDI